jgi:hypothetical protein
MLVMEIDGILVLSVDPVVDCSVCVCIVLLTTLVIRLLVLMNVDDDIALVNAVLVCDAILVNCCVGLVDTMVVIIIDVCMRMC